jgi:hypothetical protein
VAYWRDAGHACSALAIGVGVLAFAACAPSNLVALIKEKHDDAQAPIATFVVGVPGADTTGANPATEPPYHVRNALSAYAYAGSPETVDSACTGKVYAQKGPDPSCRATST